MHARTRTQICTHNIYMHIFTYVYLCMFACMYLLDCALGYRLEVRGRSSELSRLNVIKNSFHFCLCDYVLPFYPFTAFVYYFGKIALNLIEYFMFFAVNSQNYFPLHKTLLDISLLINSHSVSKLQIPALKKQQHVVFAPDM